MSRKLYFSEHDDEQCNSIAYWKQYLIENEINNVTLFEAKRETCTGYFYCTEYFEIGESKESCGKNCEGYKPNNGKNGRCKNYGYCYEQTEKTLILNKS